MQGGGLVGSRGAVLLKDISVYRAETISSSCLCVDIGLPKVLNCGNQERFCSLMVGAFDISCGVITPFFDTMGSIEKEPQRTNRDTLFSESEEEPLINIKFVFSHSSPPKAARRPQ